jgi:nicotinamidase/pyrazinamidase
MIFFDTDTQHDFLHPEGALALRGAHEILENLERLLRAAEERRLTVVSSHCAHDVDDPEFEIFPPHCVAGTRGAGRVFADLPRLPRREIPVDAAPEPGARLESATHYLVAKRTYDLFSNRWLEGLRAGGAFRGETCVVFGVATDYCVRAAGLGLAAGGARILAVDDAIRGVAPETAARAREELRAAGVEFTTTDEVLNHLQSQLSAFKFSWTSRARR